MCEVTKVTHEGTNAFGNARSGISSVLNYIHVDLHSLSGTSTLKDFSAKISTKCCSLVPKSGLMLIVEGVVSTSYTAPQVTWCILRMKLRKETIAITHYIF